MRFVTFLLLGCSTVPLSNVGAQHCDGSLTCSSTSASSAVIVETHITTVTSLQQSISTRPSERHQREKSRLLQRLDKNRDSQNSHSTRNRLFKALYSFARYEERNLAELKRWRDLYSHVPKHQKKILERTVQYSKKLDMNKQLIQLNDQLCQQILRAAFDFYNIAPDELEAYIREAETKNLGADRVSVSQALKHYVRDWSHEGDHERRTYSCILDTIGLYAPALALRFKTPPKVLLPGAGLGRLGYDIAALGGYDVTINEWSMFMNLAYRFLEAQPAAGQHVVYPFIDSWSHHAVTADLQRPVTFPHKHIDTTSVLLVEGDFTTAFQDSKGSYDFIVTHFFIDTARNLLNYLETIHATLNDGGYWINSGPLLYGTGPWVQLSLDEIIKVSEELGFEFRNTAPTCGETSSTSKEVRWMAGIYGSSERALNMNGYKVQSWVARKKPT